MSPPPPPPGHNWWSEKCCLWIQNYHLAILGLTVTDKQFSRVGQWKFFFTPGPINLWNSLLHDDAMSTTWFDQTGLYWHSYHFGCCMTWLLYGLGMVFPFCVLTLGRLEGPKGILETLHCEWCCHCAPSQPAFMKEFNEDQKRAIDTTHSMVIQQPLHPRICLIHGPPGTGKSKTINGLLYRILLEVGVQFLSFVG